MAERYRKDGQGKVALNCQISQETEAFLQRERLTPEGSISYGWALDRIVRELTVRRERARPVAANGGPGSTPVT